MTEWLRVYILPPKLGAPSFSRATAIPRKLERTKFRSHDLFDKQSDLESHEGCR